MGCAGGLFYIVFYWLDMVRYAQILIMFYYVFFYVCFEAFSGLILEHTPPPSLESRAWVREILTHMLRHGFLGRGPGTSIKERIFFGLSECPMLFDF